MATARSALVLIVSTPVPSGSMLLCGPASQRVGAPGAGVGGRVRGEDPPAGHDDRVGRAGPVAHRREDPRHERLEELVGQVAGLAGDQGGVRQRHGPGRQPLVKGPVPPRVVASRSRQPVSPAGTAVAVATSWMTSASTLTAASAGPCRGQPSGSCAACGVLLADHGVQRAVGGHQPPVQAGPVRLEGLDLGEQRGGGLLQ